MLLRLVFPQLQLPCDIVAEMHRLRARHAATLIAVSKAAVRDVAAAGWVERLNSGNDFSARSNKSRASCKRYCNASTLAKRRYELAAGQQRETEERSDDDDDGCRARLSELITRHDYANRPL